MRNDELMHIPVADYKKVSLANISEDYIFYHDTHIQVRFNDVDMLGHVNNAVYQNYFDFGKVKYFNSVLGDNVNWHENGLVLAKITVEYFSPIELNENVYIRSKIIRIGNKSLDMIQELYNKESGEIKSTGLSVMVGYSFNYKNAIVIPQNWRSKINGFEKNVLTVNAK